MTVVTGCNRRGALRFSEGGSLDSAQSLGFNPAFSCSASAPLSDQVSASTFRRIAKIHYVNSLQEFLSQLSAANRSTVLNSVTSLVQLIPDDSGKFFSRSDDRLTEYHSEPIFEIAYAVGKLLSETDNYVNQLVQVCGAGSTRASLNNVTCLNTFVKYYGQKAYRRPLTDPEMEDHKQFYTSLGSSGLAGMIGRFLAHPRFFYRLENEGSLVSGVEGVDALYRLSKYEVLSKITFLYWDAPPTDALYNLVSTLDFNQVAALDQVINTVTADSRAQLGVSNFYKEWLRLDSIPTFVPGTPAFNAFAAGENINSPGHNHRDDMIQEITDLTNYYTFSVKGRYEDLMTSSYSFARTQDLAHIYGVSPWSGNFQQMISLPPGERSGLLTRAAFLISGTEQTHPIVRGKHIRFDFLCDSIPPPPPNIGIKPLVHTPYETTRSVVASATQSTTCMGCHNSLNPLGFSMESYDALGRFRKFERKFGDDGALLNQLPVNTQVDAQLFSGDRRQVTDAVEMSSHIGTSGKGQQCLVRQYFRYTFGRSELDKENMDGCSLESLRTNLAGGSLLQMFQSTSKQSQFIYRRIK